MYTRTRWFLWTAASVLLIGSAPAWAEILGALARPAGDDPFTYGTPVSAVVPLGGSYVGVGSHVIGLQGGGGTLGVDYLGSVYELRDGQNNTSPATITMQWRTRTSLEVDGSSGPLREVGTDGTRHYADANHALAPEAYNVISDVVSATGMTGIYVAEMNYDENVIIYDPGYYEDRLAAEKWIYLGWFTDSNTVGHLVDKAEWIPAVEGNSFTGTLAVTNFVGDWDAFVASRGVGPLNLADYVGSWGVSTGNNKVWAVLDHASTFAVVPEPTTLAILALGGCMVLPRRRQR